MRLPDDLTQHIHEWFDTVYQAAFDEEIEWLLQRGQIDPGYDPEETTIEELRQSLIEYIESEPEHFIEPLLEKCGTLERAIIVALLKRQGFVRVRKVAIPKYAWVMGENP